MAKAKKPTSTPNLDALRKKIQNPKRFLEDVGKRFVLLSRERFDRTKTDPEGRRWRPWAPSTALARRKSGTASRGILLISGRLKNSVRYKATRRSLTLTATAPYAGIHQHGGRHIPRRRFIGYGRKEKQAVRQVWAKHMLTRNTRK